jgi:CDP-diacylglycerol--serine O-phosphatidyltransferase
VFLSFAGLAEAREAPLLVAAWLGLVALLMISRLRTFSPKSLRVPRERAAWIVAGLVAAAAGVIWFWLLLIVVDAIYLGSLVHALAARRGARG